MRDLRERLEVGHVAPRIADRLDEQESRLVVDCPAKLVRLRSIDEPALDAQLGERVTEQIISSAIQARAADDVLPCGADVEDRDRLGRLTRGDSEGSAAPFEQRETLFEHIARGVHQPRIDVAELLQREQSCRVIGVVEGVRRRLIDRHRPAVRRRIGHLPAVQAEGVEAVGLFGHGLALERWHGHLAHARLAAKHGLEGRATIHFIRLRMLSMMLVSGTDKRSFLRAVLA